MLPVLEDIWRVVNGCRGHAHKTRNRINYLDRLEGISLGRSSEVRNSGWRWIAVFGEPSLEEADGILVPGRVQRASWLGSCQNECERERARDVSVPRARG